MVKFGKNLYNITKIAIQNQETGLTVLIEAYSQQELDLCKLVILLGAQRMPISLNWKMIYQLMRKYSFTTNLITSTKTTEDMSNLDLTHNLMEVMVNS